MPILELICWCCILKHRGGGVVSGNNALTQPLNYSKKQKKTMLQALKNFFKTKKGNTYADIKDYFDDLYRLGVDTFCMA